MEKAHRNGCEWDGYRWNFAHHTYQHTLRMAYEYMTHIIGTWMNDNVNGLSVRARWRWCGCCFEFQSSRTFKHAVILLSGQRFNVHVCLCAMCAPSEAYDDRRSPVSSYRIDKSYAWWMDCAHALFARYAVSVRTLRTFLPYLLHASSQGAQQKRMRGGTGFWWGQLT